MVRLDHLGQHRSGRDVLPNLQRQIHQHAVDSGTNLQSVQLFLLQLRQGPRLVDLRLLLRQLRLNRFLVDRQSLLF